MSSRAAFAATVSSLDEILDRLEETRAEASRMADMLASIAEDVEHPRHAKECREIAARLRGDA